VPPALAFDIALPTRLGDRDVVLCVALAFDFGFGFGFSPVDRAMPGILNLFLEFVNKRRLLSGLKLASLLRVEGWRQDKPR
jgi:hypothetical protein